MVIAQSSTHSDVRADALDGCSVSGVGECPRAVGLKALGGLAACSEVVEGHRVSAIFSYASYQSIASTSLGLMQIRTTDGSRSRAEPRA